MYRVRQIISDKDLKKKLIKLIPKEIRDFKNEFEKEEIQKGTSIKSTYPTQLIKLLPNKYSDFGIITELLLRYVCNTEIDLEISLKEILYEKFELILEERIFELKSTIKYLKNVKETKRKLFNILDENFCIREDTKDDEIVTYNSKINKANIYDREIIYNNVIGHPDILTNNGIFEIKTSCKIFTDWNDYLLQLFSYAALSKLNNLNHEKIYLILPLQELILEYEISNWERIDEYISQFLSFKTVNLDDIFFGQSICLINGVGYTSEKEKGPLLNTFRILSRNTRIPYQIFLNGNQSTKLNISEMEMDECTAFLMENSELNIYCHLPYNINLSNNINEKDGYVFNTIKKYFKCLNRIGFKGGVLHVGKSCNYTVSKSIDNMRHHIIECLEYTTPNCPILLETPAKQGNELLTSFEEMMDFLDSIPDERFGICVDTCHVFAAGISPAEYISRMTYEERWISRLKLIHFNDSKGEKGSCVDRHARIGQGCIQKDDFLNIVSIASIYGIPMIVE